MNCVEKVVMKKEYGEVILSTNYFLFVYFGLIMLIEFYDN